MIGDQCKVLIHTGILNLEVFNEQGENVTFPASFAHELSHCSSEFKNDLYANIAEGLSWIGNWLGSWLGTTRKRQREYQADIYGIGLLANACIPPKIMIDYFRGVMEGFKQTGKPFPTTTYFWMDHPGLPDRIKALEQKLPTAMKAYEQQCKQKK